MSACAALRFMAEMAKNSRSKQLMTFVNGKQKMKIAGHFFRQHTYYGVKGETVMTF